MKKLWSKKEKLALAAAGGMLLLAAGGVMAGTGGNEFQNIYNWVNNVVTGYFGKAVAVGAVGAGALISIAKVNPMPVLGGIGFAVFEQYTPSIISGIMSAVI